MKSNIYSCLQHITTKTPHHLPFSQTKLCTSKVICL